MGNITKQNNYLSNIFLMTHSKQEKKQILDSNGVIKLFSRSLFGKELLVKTYYDTPDRFFKNSGVNISIINSKLNNENTLVVRVEESVHRSNFLSEMPNKCMVKIAPNDTVYKHSQDIIESVFTILPMGMNAPVESLVASLVPVMRITKKGESYRLISNQGLKIIFSFDDVQYENFATRIKDKSEQFLIQLDSAVNADQYNDFVHKLNMQVPTIIRMDSSDLINAYTYTSYSKK